jgi:hypothetical protein
VRFLYNICVMLLYAVLLCVVLCCRLQVGQGAGGCTCHVMLFNAMLFVCWIICVADHESCEAQVRQLAMHCYVVSHYVAAAAGQCKKQDPAAVPLASSQGLSLPCT